jgi:hypothetical protein
MKVAAACSILAGSAMSSSMAHAGIGPRHLVQQRCAAAADGHLVAQFVKYFRETACDARGAAGDENRVPDQLHCRFLVMN